MAKSFYVVPSYTQATPSKYTFILDLWRTLHNTISHLVYHFGDMAIIDVQCMFPYLEWFIVVSFVNEEVDDRLHCVSGRVQYFEGIARGEVNHLHGYKSCL